MDYVKEKPPDKMTKWLEKNQESNHTLNVPPQNLQTSVPETESKQEYIHNRKERIKELLKIAVVTMDEYLIALGTSKSGYSLRSGWNLHQFL